MEAVYEQNDDHQSENVMQCSFVQKLFDNCDKEKELVEPKCDGKELEATISVRTFGEPISDSELNLAIENRIPKRSTNWGLKVWETLV